MSDKIFKCACGKEFLSANSFNGHKNGCKEHHIAKYGTLDKYYERYKKSTEKSTAVIRDKVANASKQKSQQWVDEKHTCEKCGKIMTEKYGSGRFCSRQCANSRTMTEDVRNKIGTGVAQTAKTSAKTQARLRKMGEQNTLRAQERYYSNPDICICCGSIISYDRRNHKTCSGECYDTIVGGYRTGSGVGKHGWYKGYYCDSSYELAFVIYNLDHGIQFERNKTSYSYIGSDNKEHRYYPDFIQNDELVEVKGYVTEDVYLKLAAVNDSPIKLLTFDDINHMIEYVKNTYKCEDITSLYEIQ